MIIGKTNADGNRRKEMNFMYQQNSIESPKWQFTTQAVMDSFSTTFTHQAFGQLRVIDQNGEPWFIAYDVANILGYANTRDAVSRHCKSQTTVVKPDGGFWVIIPERDLYRLIMRSNLPAAEQFQDWVVEEVLPAIRKHGMYGTPDFIESALADPDTMIRALQALKETQRQRDYAVATKAWISRKREATAMNTASQLSKENTQLREQIGDAKTWKQARSIPWLKEFFRLDNVAYVQIGKRLTRESEALGIKPRLIEHSKYGTVKTYHSDVIQHFKHKLMSDLNFMRRYRNY